MRTAPRLIVERDPATQPLLTGAVPAVLEGALEVLREVAQHFRLPDSTVTVYRDSGCSYEDTLDQLVLTHDVNVSADAAFEYWEALADALSAWAVTLPAALREVAENRIAVSVEWPLHAQRA